MGPHTLTDQADRLVVERARTCCLCGRREFRLLFPVDRYAIVRCRMCGLAQTVDLSERPGAAGTAYDEAYFGELNQYWARREEFYAIFDRLVAQVERHRAPGRLLDVGCGIGLLLETARRRGWTVTGVEPSPFACTFAAKQLGLAVQCGQVHEVDLPAASFDVITINHVLEHVESPPQMVRAAARLLKPDGLLVVGTPNFDSWLARIAGPDWYSLQPGQHIWHFGQRTLEALLQPHGFRSIGRYTENHRQIGWRPRSLLRRVVAWLSLRAGTGEALLLTFSGPARRSSVER